LAWRAHCGHWRAGNSHDAHLSRHSGPTPTGRWRNHAGTAPPHAVLQGAHTRASPHLFLAYLLLASPSRALPHYHRCHPTFPADPHTVPCAPAWFGYLAGLRVTDVGSSFHIKRTAPARVCVASRIPRRLPLPPPSFPLTVGYLLALTATFAFITSPLQHTPHTCAFALLRSVAAYTRTLVPPHLKLAAPGYHQWPRRCAPPRARHAAARPATPTRARHKDTMGRVAGKRTQFAITSLPFFLQKALHGCGLTFEGLRTWRVPAEPQATPTYRVLALSIPRRTSPRLSRCAVLAGCAAGCAAFALPPTSACRLFSRRAAHRGACRRRSSSGDRCIRLLVVAGWD